MKSAKRTARFPDDQRKLLAELSGIHMSLGKWAYDLFDRGKTTAEVTDILKQLVEHAEAQRKST